MIWILIAATVWVGFSLLFFSLCCAASRADRASDQAEALRSTPQRATETRYAPAAAAVRVAWHH
jgi:hypothetical protein